MLTSLNAHLTPALPMDPWERWRLAGQSEAESRNSPARRRRSQELRPGSGVQRANFLFGEIYPQRGEGELYFKASCPVSSLFSPARFC